MTIHCEMAAHRFQRALNGVLERVDTPSPIVLLDIMQRNIDAMQAFATANQLELRPHVKTHKCVEIGRLQAEAGAVGITAGNLGEPRSSPRPASTTSSSPERRCPTRMTRNPQVEKRRT
jgi:hypothetical protein